MSADDPFALPAFLVRASDRVRPYAPRARAPKVRAMDEDLPAKWRGAASAVVDCFPPAFPDAFPCGRRRVLFLERPRKGTVEIRAHGSGDVAEIEARVFARARVA